MIPILRKPGWILNPSDKIVNAILKRCEANNGECPCHNTSYDKHCPCSDYRENDKCHCHLYLKEHESAMVVVPVKPAPVLTAYA